MAKDRTYLSLTAQDDYDAVVRKLGAPAHDRWLGPAGGTRYRALSYPDRACTVVLMGADGKHATYIGTLDANWKPLHSVRLGNGAGAGELLHALPRL